MIGAKAEKVAPREERVATTVVESREVVPMGAQGVGLRVVHKADLWAAWREAAMVATEVDAAEWVGCTAEGAVGCTMAPWAEVEEVVMSEAWMGGHKEDCSAMVTEAWMAGHKEDCSAMVTEAATSEVPWVKVEVETLEQNVARSPAAKVKVAEG